MPSSRISDRQPYNQGGTYYHFDFISYLRHRRTQGRAGVPAFVAHTPPLVCQTKTRAFGTRTIWRTFKYPRHDAHVASDMMEGGFAREQLLQ